MIISRIITLLVISSWRIFSTANLCPTTETYTVTSMETYTEPVVVNTFTWCLQVPPRCPKTHTEMRQRYRLKAEVKTRELNECCKDHGRMIENGTDTDTDVKCVPFCRNCYDGICFSPSVCFCKLYFFTEGCRLVCPSGTWGENCKEKCDCINDGPCNPINGVCLCSPNSESEMCNSTCPESKWGPGCTQPCNCSDSLNICDPENGDCPVTHDSTEKVSTTYLESWTTPNDESSPFTGTDANEGSKVSVPTVLVKDDKKPSTVSVSTKVVRSEDVQPSSVPIDIAIIVVASIVSLGLTSIAVVMALHMCSKLFEVVRVSIYDDEKRKNPEREGDTSGRIPTILTTGLPPTPICVNPGYPPTSGSSTILTVDSIEPLNGYANGAATIGLRISANLRDLLQDGHYDMPQAALIRLQADFDASTEHVYDEIPLQSTRYPS